jgi:hypothetical protein
VQGKPVVGNLLVVGIGLVRWRGAPFGPIPGRREGVADCWFMDTSGLR